MSIELRVKWLLYILNKNGNRGYSYIIELLVFMFIIGILAAIALPSFVNEAGKGKQSEPKQYVSSVNKAQQAWYTEKNGFVTGTAEAAFASLGVGIRTQTTNYTYSISGNTRNLVHVLAIPRSSAIKGYAGTVGLVGSGVDKTSQSVVCETTIAGKTPTGGTVNGNDVVCGSNMQQIK
ncbi:type IV pilin-like G/H family protein [Argonema galeatum]|uniref:type IV pilin-like G/H family protein n=1 Tax=Argonema galeatum TaxID=2942762 RepID=UPI0020120390|nr:type IV pilin-like G/H family protein [Argonema galeatum]MCL1467276.1 pesticin [Argonema galeatum A003/A1]